jgi:hypothetical protein
MVKLISFINSQTSVKKKINTIFFVLKVIWETPAFIFHELCHFIFLYLTGSNIIKQTFYWLKVKPNKIKGYQYICRYIVSSHADGVLVSFAPLLGLIFLLTISMTSLVIIIKEYQYIPALPWFSFLYISLNMSVFLPSQADWDAGFSSLKSLTISDKIDLVLYCASFIVILLFTIFVCSSLL